MQKRISCLAAIALGVGLLVAPLGAAEEQFFKDRRIRIKYGYPPGGGLDIAVRLIVRHISEFIPGRPKLAIEYMPGAGGRIALKYVYNIAKRDGTEWIAIPATPNIFQILDEDPKFDLTRMIYLWGSSEASFTAVRDFVGVRNPADLAKVDPKLLVIPGRSPPDTGQMALRASLELLGVKGYRTVLGYPGTAPITRALLAGEVSLYDFTLLTGLKGGILHDSIERGEVFLLWQSGLLDPEGRVVRDPRINLPTFLEVHEKLMGKPPAGIAWEAFKPLAPGTRTLTRAILVPPGVPENRARVLRKAFDAVMKSPAFVAETQRVTGIEWDTYSGEDAQKIYRSFLKGVTPEVVAYMKHIMQ